MKTNTNGRGGGEKGWHFVNSSNGGWGGGRDIAVQFGYDANTYTHVGKAIKLTYEEEEKLGSFMFNNKNEAIRWIEYCLGDKLIK